MARIKIPKIEFDREKQYAVLKTSICTGESVVGFKNLKDGHFTEVMLITSDEEMEQFKKFYGIDAVKKEY